jgi:hypothetical protein
MRMQCVRLLDLVMKDCLLHALSEKWSAILKHSDEHENGNLDVANQSRQWFQTDLV